MKIAATLLIIAFASLAAVAQAPTLRIVTETPGLPSELFYGTVKVKPIRLRPGTNKVITVDDIDFFVQQQYLDFLGRFPDHDGFTNWFNTLNQCPDGGFGEFAHPECDRIHVSAGFVQSYEFQGRGDWLLRVSQVGLDRRMTYSEFVPALHQIGGSNTAAQEEAAKVAYLNALVQTTEFKNRYDSLSNSAFLDALESNAEVTINKSQYLAELNGGTSRARVLREIVELQTVFDKFLIRGFVTMEYFGYLRRDPDTIGYKNWVDTLTADPSNYRHMIFGFIYSDEYRNRF